VSASCTFANGKACKRCSARVRHLTHCKSDCAQNGRKGHWSSTADVKRRYAAASVVSADRIVFNIKGNDYRLVVSVDYEKGIVWIKWLGTHREYDRIDVRGVQHERS
jgi:mRNA-degrading endonuclease HigB of HigAB toxin-antitoxin module